MDSDLIDSAPLTRLLLQAQEAGTGFRL